jgi:hypothetical protein
MFAVAAAAEKEDHSLVVFVAAKLGKTIIPYKMVSRNTKKILKNVRYIENNCTFATNPP